MKKLLSLTTKDWFTGLAAGSHLDTGGLWYEAKGINPFVDTSGKTRNAGLLQSCTDVTDITNSISGVPLAYASDLQNDEMWYVASSMASTEGTIAKIGMLGMTSPSAEFTTGGTRGLGSGMGIFQPSGGTRYLYYFDVDAASITQSRLMRIDIDSVTPTIQTAVLTDLNFNTDFTASYLARPMIPFKDGLYFGHMNNIGYVRDDGDADIITSSNDLDITDDKIITALSEDGTFLIIAATSNTSMDYRYTGDTRVYFYDTNQSSWTREWAIPDSHIYGMKRVGNAIYAMTGSGIWVFNYQTRPYKIRTLDNNQTGTSSYVFNNSVSVFNNAFAWGSQNNLDINVYGEPMQGINLTGVFHTPFSSGSTPKDDYNVSMMASDARKDVVIVGSTGSGIAGKLYKYATNTGGDDAIAKSVYIPLAETTHIKEFKLTFAEPINATDKVVVSVIPETLEDEGDWVTAVGYVLDDLVFNNGIAYQCISAHTSGASTEPGVGASWEDEWKSLEFGTVDGSTADLDQKVVTLRSSVLDVENLGFTVAFQGGNPKIKRLEVYGTSHSHG